MLLITMSTISFYAPTQTKDGKSLKTPQTLLVIAAGAAARLFVIRPTRILQKIGEQLYTLKMPNSNEWNPGQENVMLCLRRNPGSDACYDVTLESENGDIGTLGIIATPGKLPLNAPLEGKSVTLSGVDLGATWSDQASEVQLQLADGSGDLTLAKSSPGDVDAIA